MAPCTYTIFIIWLCIMTLDWFGHYSFTYFAFSLFRAKNMLMASINYIPFEPFRTICTSDLNLDCDIKTSPIFRSPNPFAILLGNFQSRDSMQMVHWVILFLDWELPHCLLLSYLKSLRYLIGYLYWTLQYLYNTLFLFIIFSFVHCSPTLNLKFWSRANW